MAELDAAKAKLRYLELWLVILVIADFGSFGWLISNVEWAEAPLLWSAVIAVLVLTAGIVLLHRRIKAEIQSLKGP